MLATGRLSVVNTLRCLVAHRPNGRSIQLIGEIMEPKGVSEAAQRKRISEAELVGPLVGVASRAKKQESVKWHGARLVHLELHSLIAVPALIQYAASQWANDPRRSIAYRQLYSRRMRRDSVGTTNPDRVVARCDVAGDANVQLRRARTRRSNHRWI